ncbi:MAG: DNA-protecting protein DprA [Erysipelothrix sp.]|nr:DNA-protecting protein DprA [Erysipelothrix sp.]
MRERILYYALKYDGDYNKIAKAILNKESYKKANCKDNFIIIGDKDYPKKLLSLKKPPFILFYKGDIKLLKKEAVAIVGSRKMTLYGKKYTNQIASILSNKYVIVSGLAAGVDSEAHKSSIIKGKSIAVLGSGINYIYPKSNTNLYNYMQKDNLIISEYPNGVVPKPYYFPFRNRIIAALSKSVVVTQAALRSGTMLTVNEALELNKDIYVLPYSIEDSAGSGCNYLIQQGANIILIEDLIDLCNNI